MIKYKNTLATATTKMTITIRKHENQMKSQDKTRLTTAAPASVFPINPLLKLQVSKI